MGGMRDSGGQGRPNSRGLDTIRVQASVDAEQKGEVMSRDRLAFIAVCCHDWHSGPASRHYRVGSKAFSKLMQKGGLTYEQAHAIQSMPSYHAFGLKYGNEAR